MDFPLPHHLQQEGNNHINPDKQMQVSAHMSKHVLLLYHVLLGLITPADELKRLLAGREGKKERRNTDIVLPHKCSGATFS